MMKSSFFFLLILQCFALWGQISVTVDSMVTQNATCFGDSNGVISIALDNADGYNQVFHVWSDSMNNTIEIDTGTEAQLVGLSAGTYRLMVAAVDTNGMPDTAMFEFNITQPVQVGLNFTAIDPGCSGAANGQVILIGLNGVPPYRYAIDGISFITGDTFPGLKAESYQLVTKDANNCKSPQTDITLTADSLENYAHHDSAFNIPYGNGDGVWSALVIFDADDLGNFYNRVFKTISIRMSGSASNWGAVILRIREDIQVSGTGHAARISDFGTKVFERNITNELEDNPSGFTCIDVGSGCTWVFPGKTYAVEVQVAPVFGKVPEIGVDAGPMKEGKGGWFINAEHADGKQLANLGFGNTDRNWNIRAEFGLLPEAICGGVGIEPTTGPADLIKIYPNPSEEYFNIENLSPEIRDWTYELFDIHGMLIVDELVPEYRSSVEMNVLRLPPAAYLLKVKNGEMVFIKKVLIVR